MSCHCCVMLTGHGAEQTLFLFMKPCLPNDELLFNVEASIAESFDFGLVWFNPL